MGRPVTDYQALPLEEIAARYIAGESIRTLAAEFEVADHKTLAKYVRPLVEQAGGTMRTHRESQQIRRQREFAAKDLGGFYDYALGHVTGPEHRATRGKG